MEEVDIFLKVFLVTVMYHFLGFVNLEGCRLSWLLDTGGFRGGRCSIWGLRGGEGSLRRARLGSNSFGEGQN